MPIIKRRSWGFQNTPNLWSLDDFEPSYDNLKKEMFWENFIFFKLPQLGPKLFKLYKLGVFWNPQDLFLMMGTEIFKIDASWAEELTKMRVQFLLAPTVGNGQTPKLFEISYCYCWEVDYMMLRDYEIVRLCIFKRLFVVQLNLPLLQLFSGGTVYLFFIIVHIGPIFHTWPY